MRALITGASGGIGLEFAKELSYLGYDLILVARNKKKLKMIQLELKTNVEIIPMDLSIEKNVYLLYKKIKGRVDLLINNAGFGVFGRFDKTDLNEEIDLINLNIKTYHILTKLFLIDFKNRDSGRILNVASSAAFQPGPLFSSYYASKAYVYSLSCSIFEELRREKSKVQISVLCPGPVDTGFNERAGVHFLLRALNSKKVVKYTLKKLEKKKLIITPGFFMKLGIFLTRFLSRKFVLKFTYNIQKSKETLK